MGLVYEVELPVVSGGKIYTRVLETEVDGVLNRKNLEFSDTVTRLTYITLGSKVTLTLKNVDYDGNETNSSDPVSFTANISNMVETNGFVTARLIDCTDVSPVPSPPIEVEPPVVEPEPEKPIINLFQ